MNPFLILHAYVIQTPPWNLMNIQILDFEKPLAELENKIEDLQRMGAADEGSIGLSEEVFKLRRKHRRGLIQLYKSLSPAQKVQVARHSQRPRCKDYIKHMITDFTPLAGDRLYAEDQAIVSGIGRFQGQSVMVLGHERGGDTESRLKHRFGMANPEGYRKAIRLMDLADRFKLPVLCLVDTPGAYPGIGAEERGQAEAIAKSIEKCLAIRVPIISCVTGEGGSGGAIALATANAVLMLSHSIYSVISPEGCASILWRDAAKAKEAAEALKLTAQDLKSLGIIDEIISEPVGGAHRQPEKTMNAVSEAFGKYLGSFAGMSGEQLLTHRREKFLAMGRGL